MSNNTNRSTILSFSKCQLQVDSYILVFMHTCWPNPQGEKASWPLNASSGEIFEWKQRSQECLKLIIIQNRRRKCLAILATILEQVSVTTNHAGTWLDPYLHEHSVLEAKKQIFVWRKILLSIYQLKIANYHSWQLLWLTSQISVQCNMVGFVMDSHTSLASYGEKSSP